MTKSMLITGGAGFIGANAARHFAMRNWNVTVFDNLSRRGAETNLTWLNGQAEIEFIKGDVRDAAALMSLMSSHPFDAVLHLAAQVAVTTSVTDPRQDFETNVLGTFNVLEAVRHCRPEALVIFASTNKVYGKMDDVRVTERRGRYEYDTLVQGVAEDRPLDFHSPYGCSKGAADQYVIDYARIYGLHTTAFRQSCIYGPRQFGVEDQGWVAWFIIAAVLGKPLTIYGDGRQVRDVLHVDDLVRAYETAIHAPEKVSGRAFNIGGGPQNTLSLLELCALLERELGAELAVKFDDWRPGDQKVFVCDIERLGQVLSWRPTIGTEQGVLSLIRWVRENQDLFRD